jgi:hypothetical protein
MTISKYVISAEKMRESHSKSKSLQNIDENILMFYM